MIGRHPPGWTPARWGPPASGWTPASAGYPPRAAGQMFGFTRVSWRRGWTLDSGGFPKNRPCRWRYFAPSPPAYVSARKGTGKQRLGGLDPGRTPEASPGVHLRRKERRFARAHDPEYIAMDSVSGAIRLAVRCLAGNCLTRLSSLDRLATVHAPPRLPMREKPERARCFLDLCSNPDYL
jgi:hypothetical protein